MRSLLSPAIFGTNLTRSSSHWAFVGLARRNHDPNTFEVISTGPFLFFFGFEFVFCLFCILSGPSRQLISQIFA